MAASLSSTSQTAEGTTMANSQTLKTCKNNDLANSDTSEELDKSIMVDLQNVSEQLQHVPTVCVCCVLMLQVNFFQISLVAFAFSGRSELLM